MSSIRMRAAVSERYGPPEVVRIQEVNRPTPKEKELLIEVHATTVNRTDCGYRSGKPFLIKFFSGWRKPKAIILGTEYAGVVEAVGSEVTKFSVGERVCGYCEGTFGSHAEYMTIGDHRLIARIPQDRTFEQAAPSTEGSHYALGMLRRSGMKEGDSVLVYGATGAIGSAAVQLAKSMGLWVTAVCGSAHVDLVKGLGADKVVDYQTTDFTRDDRRYDLVLDAVGKSSFRRCKRLLKPKGIYTGTDFGRVARMAPFIIPAFIGHLLQALFTRLLGGRRTMFVLPHRDPEAVRFLTGLIESGEFKPVVDRVYPLEQIAEAYRYAETGQKIGNLVITM